MIPKILLAFIVISNLLFSKTYSDIKYTKLSYSKNGTNKSFKLDGYKLTVGEMFEDLLKDFSTISIGVENSILIAGGTNISSVGYRDDTVLNRASVDVDFLYALHLKATAPLVDFLHGNIYLGLDTAKVGARATNYANSSGWDSSISYGFGLEYWIPADISIQLSYMSYFDNMDGVEFGLGFKF